MGDEKTDSLNSRCCIYCEQCKPEEEFSLEHIFPDSLGGALCSDLFKTRDVCRSCNSTAGLFIDGPFIKSWFRTNEDALAAREYLDLDSPTSIEPLVYMGTLRSLQLQPGDTCEYWQAACGSSVYHFHIQDDPQYDIYTGGNPIKRKRDRGRVYLRLASTDPRWNMLAIRSVVAHFRKAKRYAINFATSGNLDVSASFDNPDERAQKDLEELRTLSSNTHTIRMGVQQDFETRFLAKFARGIGYKLFGAPFLSTECAGHLKAALWEKDFAKRALIPVRGKGFFDDGLDIEALWWPGAYTIVLLPTEADFVAVLYLQRGKSLGIVVSDQPEFWKTPELEEYREGIVFLILPQLGRAVGPVSLPDYLAHRLRCFIHPELAELENKRKDPSSFPPCRA